MRAEQEIATTEGLSKRMEDLLIAVLTTAACYAESGNRRTALLTAMYLRALADYAEPGPSDRIRETCEQMATRWSLRAARKELD